MVGTPHYSPTRPPRPVLSINNIAFPLGVLLVLGIYGNWLASSRCKPDDFLRVPTASEPVKAGLLDEPAASEEFRWEQPADYEPVLPPEALVSSMSHNGLARRFHKFVGKLVRGQAVHISTLGGSVTAGVGAVDNRPWATKYLEWVNGTFPHPGHRLTNGGGGGATGDFFQICLDGIVPEDADIVVIEMAYNLGPPNTACNMDSARAIERIVRSLLLWPSQPAIVLLHHYGYPYAFDPKLIGTFVNSFEDMASLVGQYYEVPELSLRQSAYHLMRTGHLQVEGYVQSPSKEDRHFYSDFVHPSHVGHQALADLLNWATWDTARCVHAADSGGCRGGGAVGCPRACALKRGPRPVAAGGKAARAWEQASADAGASLPRPLVAGNYDRERFRCLMGRQFEAVGARAEGFAYQPHNTRETVFVLQKWSWTGEGPGKWVEFEVDTRWGGRAAGERGEQQQQQQQGAGRNTTDAILGYMRSYQSMGDANVTCVAGCSCKPSTLRGTWQDRVSMLDTHRFQVTTSPSCRIRVEVLPETSSDGHKLSLVYLAVLREGRDHE